MKRFPGGQSVRYVEAPVTRTAGEGEGPPLYTISLSSEHPVERRGFFGLWREVLDHSPESIQLGRMQSGTAPLLEEHRGAPIGVVAGIRLDSTARKLYGDVRFGRSARAVEVQQDVDDGIRSSTSVGYIPKRARLVEENEELGDLWRVTLWEPVEVSFVGIPADPTVGLNRAADDGAGAFPPVVVEGSESAEEDAMKKVRGDGNSVIEVADDDPRPAISERGMSDAERDEVLRLAQDYGASTSEVAEWLRSNKSSKEVMNLLLEKRLTKAEAQPGGETLEDIGVSRKEAKAYSYSRAILGAAQLAEGKPFDGLEARVHEELVRRAPQNATMRGGVMVPLNVGTRALTSGTATKGAELVYEQKGELIELLRNSMAVARLGARILPGLNGPITFPKQVSATTAYWVGENPASPVTASDLGLGFAQLAPKTLQATTSYSRQLLNTAGWDVESMVVGDLSAVHALAMDYAAIHGLGSAGEPVGLYYMPGIGTKAIGGALDFPLLVSMQGIVAAANAYMGTLGWLTHPTVASNLRAKATFTNTGTPIWTGTYEDGQVAGYRAIATKQVSDTMSTNERTGGSSIGVIFGNWNDLLLGYWGGMELVVDPYALKKYGLIEVTSFQMCDVLARHGESFVKGTGCTG